MQYICLEQYILLERMEVRDFLKACLKQTFTDTHNTHEYCLMIYVQNYDDGHTMYNCVFILLLT